MAWDHDGKSRHERGYGSRWVRLRARILSRDGHLCQPCLIAGRTTPATQVDHITPKAKGGTDEAGNLQGICRACHDAKTLTEATGHAHRRKVRIGLDGWPQD